MNIDRIDTFDGFLALRDEWNTLIEKSTSNCVFLTHEWLSTWWKHMAADRRLRIATARDGGRLVGILPLAERKAQYTRMMPRVLEFIGSGVIGSDYLDAIVDRDYQPNVMAAFAHYLNDSPLMLQLNQVRSGSSIVALLAEELRQVGWTTAETQINVCPYIKLGGHTWDSYLETMGALVRKGVKRYFRNLPAAFEFRVDCVQTPAEAQAALDVAIDLHRQRWHSGRKSEAFQSDSVIAFHREFVQHAAERGWLRLFVMYLNGTPAAALYGLRYDTTFYFYQSGFDPAYRRHSVGAATMAISVKSAIEEGVLVYDFLHGAEEYKFHWTQDTSNLARIELHPPRARAWVYKQAMGLNRAARQMARRVLDIASNVALSR